MSAVGDWFKSNSGTLLDKGLDLIPSGNTNTDYGGMSATQAAQPKSNILYYILGGFVLLMVFMMGKKK